MRRSRKRIVIKITMVQCTCAAWCAWFSPSRAGGRSRRSLPSRLPRGGCRREKGVLHPDQNGADRRRPDHRLPDPFRCPRGARLIGGKGKFLMPGLWDMACARVAQPTHPRTLHRKRHHRCRDMYDDQPKIASSTRRLRNTPADVATDPFGASVRGIRGRSEPGGQSQRPEPGTTIYRTSGFGTLERTASIWRWMALSERGLMEVTAMFRAGVSRLAGTDTEAPFFLPGFWPAQ
jgi:hypothetical protein